MTETSFVRIDNFSKLLCEYLSSSGGFKVLNFAGKFCLFFLKEFILSRILHFQKVFNRFYQLIITFIIITG